MGFNTRGSRYSHLHDQRVNLGEVSTPTILCALSFEARRLSRRLRIPIQICGPGETGIRRWSSGPSERQPDRGSTVILAGVAGALTDRFRPGMAGVISEIALPDGRTLVPALKIPGGQPIRLTSSRHLISSPLRKRDLASSTQADLVDMEGVAFAQVAMQRGWHWGVVRGAGDALSDRLPPQMENWIDPAGRTRIGAAMAYLLSHPHMIPDVLRISRQSSLALDSVASLVASLLRQG